MATTLPAHRPAHLETTWSPRGGRGRHLDDAGGVARLTGPLHPGSHREPGGVQVLSWGSAVLAVLAGLPAVRGAAAVCTGVSVRAGLVLAGLLGTRGLVLGSGGLGAAFSVAGVVRLAGAPFGGDGGDVGAAARPGGSRATGLGAAEIGEGRALRRLAGLAVLGEVRERPATAGRVRGR